MSHLRITQLCERLSCTMLRVSVSQRSHCPLSVFRCACPSGRASWRRQPRSRLFFNDLRVPSANADCYFSAFKMIFAPLANATEALEGPKGLSASASALACSLLLLMRPLQTSLPRFVLRSLYPPHSRVGYSRGAAA